MNKSDIKLFIATPCQKEVCVNYCISLVETVQTMEMSDIRYEVDYVIGSCYVEDARNTAVHRFLKSDCTHLFFIDSDISWTIENFRDLFYAIRKDRPILGGIYPKKKVDEQSIVYSVVARHPIKDHIGTIDRSMFSPTNQIKHPEELKDAIEVDHLPTGFMIISREVFDAHKKAFPDKAYKDDEYGDEDTFQYFHNCLKIINGERVSVGEDINFCQTSRELGFKVYCLPSVSVSHWGDFEYKKRLI